MKQVVFNVGGALSSYIEFDNKTLLVDLGASSDYNPIRDFLLPLYKRKNSPKSLSDSNKYHIDQLLISHPHKDHISVIEDFDDYFYPELLTTPNDNLGMPEYHNINWQEVGNENDVSIIRLRKMLETRIPPLRATSDQNEFIYYLPPEDVENNDTLYQESYLNNISITVFLIINGFRVFLPGDIQKEGMKKLIEQNHYLRNKLKGGVDILLAPHHGLRSSFSLELFTALKEEKTRCLNIVSEKINTNDNREVDTRYSSSDYCLGENNLSGGNGVEECYQVKTSRGHIYIDYSERNNPKFEIVTDNEKLIKKFQ